MEVMALALAVLALTYASSAKRKSKSMYARLYSLVRGGKDMDQSKYLEHLVGRKIDIELHDALSSIAGMLAESSQGWLKIETKPGRYKLIKVEDVKSIAVTDEN